MVSDSLDITQELLGRYGGLMAVEQHEVLQDALLPLLDEQRGGLRKRAISGLGAGPASERRRRPARHPAHPEPASLNTFHIVSIRPRCSISA